jgi:hypothetical protein
MQLLMTDLRKIKPTKHQNYRIKTSHFSHEQTMKLLTNSR